MGKIPNETSKQKRPPKHSLSTEVRSCARGECRVRQLKLGIFLRRPRKFPAPNSPANKMGGESPAAKILRFPSSPRRKTPPTPILRFRVPSIPPLKSSSKFSPLRRRFSNSSADSRRRSHHSAADFQNSSPFFFDVPSARHHRRL